jgi:FRG domain
VPTVDPVWLDFLEFIAIHNDKWTFFRGLPNSEWVLAPGIARSDKAPAAGWSLGIEMRLFLDFKRMAQTFEPGQSFSDLDWLALAQHFGLPTRLLDWTDNPLVAAWFAVGDEREHKPKPPRRSLLPGIVHAVRVDPHVIEESPQPFVGGVAPVLVRVPPRAIRITAQHGLFSLHRDPLAVWDLATDRRVDHHLFQIPHASKHTFRIALDRIGFNRQRLMVDLEGLCATLAWRYRIGRI